jgi:hypothetical protein
MITLTEIEAITPHVADKIEPGAILFSSWGYEQTNVDFYMVVRTTDVSCWVLSMESRETLGQAYDTGYATPLRAVTHYDRCICEHRVSKHDEHGCSFFDHDTSEWCDCQAVDSKQIAPKRHKILRYGGEFISLTSFSNAYLWDGER